MARLVAMAKKNPFFRWCRRRWRRLLRALWLLWMPIGLMCDLLAIGLVATGRMNAVRAEWLSLIAIHFTLFCAAAFTCREGAAAAAAGFRELLSSLNSPAVHVVTVQFHVAYSVVDLTFGLVQALCMMALHITLLLCRLGHVVGLVVIQYPLACSVLVSLHMFDLI